MIYNTSIFVLQNSAQQHATAWSIPTYKVLIKRVLCTPLLQQHACTHEKELTIIPRDYKSILSTSGFTYVLHRNARDDRRPVKPVI